jgi:tRNA-specific 2-thiouridylase
MSGPLTAVAMSGGVDSSVAACLLARRGRSLVGLSMRLLGPEGKHDGEEPFREARRLAERLGFPHHVVDLEEEFRRLVVEPFAEEYAAGRTPSPCVRCNRQVKFGALLERARCLGAGRIATGHYAALEPDPATGRTLLLRAADKEKDQSYFLFDLSDEQRAVAEFPLGGLEKREVRRLAREMGIPAADRPESMDLCFVAGGQGYRDFLQRSGLFPGDEPGEVVDVDGSVLGSHEGISGFTVGQRRGIGVASHRKLYVLRVDAGRNRVVVGGAEEAERERCRLESVRWIPFDRPDGELRATVRIRSTHAGAVATLTDLGGGRADLRFERPLRGLAPGQAAVAYDGDLVLGGGWISAD